MKLATIGFYYDFTRLFAKLEGQVTFAGTRVEVTNYATHASGYLFENAKGMGRVFLPVAARRARNAAPIDTGTLDWLGQYLVISGLSTRRARHIAQRYGSYFLDVFERDRPDVVIISGDTRMQSRAAAFACHTLGIQYYFFEQGPFGTTILDPKGVNCTASFAKTFSQVPPQTGENAEPKTRVVASNPKVAERKAVRALDFFVQPLFLALGYHEIREEKAFFKQVSRQIWSLRKSRTKAEPPPQTPQPFVLIVGQVPTDANFSLNSPYDAPLDLVRDVEGMFSGANILFREHPLYIGSYGADFYAHFDASPSLSFSRGTPLDAEIEAADHVVVVNSTVGMEVVLKHQKTILCLGDASYQHLNGVYLRDDLAAFTNAATAIPDDGHATNWAWFHNSFLQGHFRDLDLQPLISNILERLDEN